MASVSRAIALVGALAVVGCDRPRPLIICHNGNCARTGAVAEDDTPEGLAESLALRWRGRPVIDGVELDTMWHRPTGACLFAHGPGLVLPPDTAGDAATLVIAHLAGDDVAWNGERFHVYLELKGYVAGRFDEHTPEERVAHVDCVLDVFERLVAATAGRHRLQVVFASADPRLLRALIVDPRWPGRIDGDVEVRLAGDSGALWDQLVLTPHLDEYRGLDLDLMQYLAGHLTDARRDVYDSLGLELCQWGYAVTTESLTELTRQDPAHTITGEAMAVRRWLEE